MTEATHTPGPYFFENKTVYALNIMNVNRMTCSVQGGYTDTGKTSDAELLATAAFIVRACNSHNELLDTMKALLDAVRKEPAMNNKKYDVLGIRVLDAIKKATGA